MDESILARMEQAKRARDKTLAHYRANQFTEMTLKKSGLTVYLRDASITDLMLAGKLPESLLGSIVAQSDGQAVDLKKFAGESDFGALVDAVVMACAVEPPIGVISDDLHLGLHEIPADDRMDIFNWANREVAPVADQFRGQPAEPGLAA
jgi:hypothetical protein